MRCRFLTNKKDVLMTTGTKLAPSFPMKAFKTLRNELSGLFNPDYSARTEIVNTALKLGYVRMYESVLEETYSHPSRLHAKSPVHPSISITYDRHIPTVRVTTPAGHYYGLVGNRETLKAILLLLHGV